MTPLHCRHGHEWTEHNSRLNSQGNRICRTCNAENQQAYRVRRKLAEEAAAAELRVFEGQLAAVPR